MSVFARVKDRDTHENDGLASGILCFFFFGSLWHLSSTFAVGVSGGVT